MEIKEFLNKIITFNNIILIILITSNHFNVYEHARNLANNIIISYSILEIIISILKIMILFFLCNIIVFFKKLLV